ncbi:MAG TPA: multicopper oxidase domain-containing protein, partial [candidate division Zixibacteria bacterium]|nr:multicopper oxidase domain-containing protein [candidate division Zixibacteria bacterium]
YEVAMTEFMHKMHSQLPASTVWGYNGTYPGPTIEATVGQPIEVKWINSLPAHHLFAIDYTICGAEAWQPEVRTVVHLHGGHVPAESDGYPEAWFTAKNFGLYEYPNNQMGATLWYHDHAMGISRLNVYAGLAGFYLLRDMSEVKFKLPSGVYEMPLMIQDKSFNKDGSLYYPEKMPSHFFGNTAVVNGKVWPYMNVEPTKYRFRVLNASNARFFSLKLLEVSSVGTGSAIEIPGPAFYQIGTDGGFMQNPVMLNNPNDQNSPRLLLSPAERADIIIDFSGYEGKNFILHNNAGTPFKTAGHPDEQVLLSDVMLFKVGYRASVSAPPVPPVLHHSEKLLESSAKQVRTMTLEETMDDHGRSLTLLNGKHWEEPITEKIELGSTEIWNIANLTNEIHPIHLHLVMFQILDRRPFDINEYKKSGKLIYTGPAVSPDKNEMGWKDTFRCNPGEVSRIIARFDDYSGMYMWHCHVLEHGDHEMMRPLEVASRAEGTQLDNDQATLSEIRSKFEVFQNYPNPFNPTTNINFYLPEAGNWTVRIYNILGQELVEYSGYSPAGNVSREWNASNEPSGLYLYTVEANGVVEKRKMMLMK